MSDKSVKEKRMTVSVAKVSTNIIICLLISLGLIITSFFLLKDLKLTLADKTFWLQKILMGSLTFVLMICISTIVEELKGQKDADLNDKFKVRRPLSTCFIKGRKRRCRIVFNQY